MARVLCVGTAVLDIVMGVEDLPDAARKYRAREATVVGGGCAANAAVAIARLGGQALIGARLGDDDIGGIIAHGLTEEGVDCRLLRPVPGAVSSFSSVLVDAAGNRQIVNFPGRGLSDDPSVLESAPPCDAVLADTRWVEGTLAAFRLARAWGVPAVLDGEPPIDPRLLMEATHVVLSRPGLASLAEGPPEDALAELAARLGVWTAVTDGEHGTLAVTPNGPVHFPAYPVTAVDTLGAGDVWHGAFALILAEGGTEADAARFASAAAALKCLGFGGRAAIPDRATTEAFLQEHAA